MIGGVYSITCLPTGMVYIGSSQNVPTRLGGHKNALRKAGHYNQAMQGDYLQYGEESFDFCHTHLTDKKADYIRLEHDLIEQHKAKGIAYNIFNKKVAPEEVCSGMSHQEFSIIVEAWGGTEKFANIIDANERTVRSWLYGERKIKPPIAKLIRSLKPTRKKGTP